jgi:adenylate kinase family enzyme
MKRMRVSIIGNSGSGKSTIASSLSATHALPTLDLDTVAWEPAKVAVARDAAVATSAVRSFCETAPHWVVEGCYGNLIAATLQYSPMLLFVEPGVEVCLAHCRARPWEPHKYPSKEEQDGKLEFLLAWVREYYTRQGDLSFSARQTTRTLGRMKQRRSLGEILQSTSDVLYPEEPGKRAASIDRRDTCGDTPLTASLGS